MEKSLYDVCCFCSVAVANQSACNVPFPYSFSSYNEYKIVSFNYA